MKHGITEEQKFRMENVFQLMKLGKLYRQSAEMCENCRCGTNECRDNVRRMNNIAFLITAIAGVVVAQKEDVLSNVVYKFCLQNLDDFQAFVDQKSEMDDFPEFIFDANTD